MSTRAAQFEILASGLQYNADLVTVPYVTFFAAGTDDPKAAWDDKDKASAITKKALDTQGRAEVFGDGIYKMKFYAGDPDAAAPLTGVLLFEIDDYKVQSTTFSVVQKVGDYTATPDDDVILCNGTFTVNIQAVADFGHPLTIKNIGIGTITINPYAAETIDGDPTYSLTGTDTVAQLYPDTASNVWRLGYQLNDVASITFSASGVGAVSRNAQSKLRDVVSIKDFGADPGESAATNKTAIEAAIAAVGDGGAVFFPQGTYLVNGILIDGVSGLKLIGDFATLKGPASGAVNAVLELKNSVALTMEGINIHGNYNPDLVAGIWGYTDDSSQFSLSKFNDTIFSGCPIAFKFGHASYVDALVSEITVSGGYTYGCPIPIQLIGTQTAVNVDGYHLISGLNGGAGDYLTLPRRVAEVKGGHLNITGVECLITDSAGDVCFNIEPIESAAYDNPYGKISVVNCLVESASQLAISYNPDSIATPTGGMIRLIGCSGYHSGNSFSFIQTETDFAGKIIVQGGDFYAGSARTQKNIECANDAADVYCDDFSFGENFVQGLAGITGGTVHFTFRQVLSVSNLNGQSLPNASETDLKFTSVTTTGDLGRFSTAYSAATGIFTVPVGGLKNIQIRGQLNKVGLSTSDLYIKINGTVYGAVSPIKPSTQISFFVPSLAYNDTIKITLLCADGALTADSDASDQFDIFASN